MESTTNPSAPLDLDEVTRRPDVEGSGEIPRELLDPANYLVLDRIGDDRERPDIELEARDERLVITDDRTVLGVVAPQPISTTVEELEQTIGNAESDSGDGHVPGWLTTSATPRLAPQSEERVLRRRDGTKVRPEWVIQPGDSRSPYYPNTYPLTCVGRLFVWDNAANPGWSWWGTASLVSSRTILTASHCVPWGSGNWKALFIPAYYDGASIFGASAASWVTNAQGYSSHAQGDDMAVMRLAVPLGNSLGWFGYRTYNDAWEDQGVWNLPGYPWDKFSGNRPVIHSGFPIIDDDNDGAGVELEYKADTEGGQSGAPVYGWWGSTPAVIGTHSGGEDNIGEPRQNVAAGGAALSNLIAWARTNWG